MFYGAGTFPQTQISRLFCDMVKKAFLAFPSHLHSYFDESSVQCSALKRIEVEGKKDDQNNFLFCSIDEKFFFLLQTFNIYILLIKPQC